MKNFIFFDEATMNTLRKQRKCLGMTQHDLSRATGIIPSRIAFFETGRRQLTDREIARIKKALARRAAKVAAIAAIS